MAAEGVTVVAAFSFLFTLQTSKKNGSKSYQFIEPSDKAKRDTDTVCVISTLEIWKAGNYKFTKKFTLLSYSESTHGENKNCCIVLKYRFSACLPILGNTPSL